MIAATEHHRLALPVGTMIEHFCVEAVLGKGGFGITYRALDTQLGKQVAIKELLPDTIATRVDGSTVVPQSVSLEDNWQWARERFLDEARTLAGFSHPAIVGVHRLIEANGTVYLVMDFIEGESFEARLKRIGREPDQASLMAVMGPILEGLEEIHAKGLLHRDIKPDNILINQRGQPILIDFGSAREAVGKTVAMTSIVTHGYSPIEQYQTKGRMGPWTDIYAVAAVMCRAISGEKPPVAADRIVEDEFQWLTYQRPAGCEEIFLQSIDWALRVRSEDRPSSIESWKSYLLSGSHLQESAQAFHTSDDVHPPEIKQPTSGNFVLEPDPAIFSESHGFTDFSSFGLGEFPFCNSLGMIFVPMPGTSVCFSIWPTRRQDYQAFFADEIGIDKSWLEVAFCGLPVCDGETHPVVMVSREDAMKFCCWLSGKEILSGVLPPDLQYRLPTDKEWSTAVGIPDEKGNTASERTDTPRVYPWGNQWPPPRKVGNFADQTLRLYLPTAGFIKGYQDGYSTTSPVGNFRPNDFGLYDLSGNVWEWCEDSYDGTSSGASVYRGGSWRSYDELHLRSAFRGISGRGARHEYCGFRLVLGRKSE